LRLAILLIPYWQLFDATPTQVVQYNYSVSDMPVFWIKENRMFGTFVMKNTAFFYQMADEVTAFHGATFEPGLFSSGFPRLSLCLLVPAGFPV